MNAFRIAGVLIVMGILGALLFIYIKHTSEPFKIGYAGTISGKYAAMGISGRNGAVLAMEEINAQGGIKNRALEFSVVDDAGDPAATLDRFKELKQKEIRIVVGPFTTAAATAVLPFINEHGILTIGPQNAGENLAKTDDFFIKLFPSTKTIGERIAELAVSKGLKRVAIITDHRNKRFGDTMIRGAVPVFEQRGVKVTGVVEFYSSKNVSHSDLAEGAMTGAPQGIFIISSPIDTALLAQNLKQFDKDVQLFTSPWAISKELVENGGGAVEGLLFYVPFLSEDESPSYQGFKDRYRKRFSDEPTHVSIFNYEAVNLLAKGLEAESSGDPAKVKSALLGIREFEGIQSEFTLDENGDADRSLYLHQIKSGKFIPLQAISQ